MEFESYTVTIKPSEAWEITKVSENGVPATIKGCTIIGEWEMQTCFLTPGGQRIIVHGIHRNTFAELFAKLLGETECPKGGYEATLIAATSGVFDKLPGKED